MVNKLTIEGPFLKVSLSDVDDDVLAKKISVLKKIDVKPDSEEVKAVK